MGRHPFDAEGTGKFEGARRFHNHQIGLSCSVDKNTLVSKMYRKIAFVSQGETGNVKAE